MDRQPETPYLPGGSDESGLLQQGELFYSWYCLKLPRHYNNKKQTDLELVLLLFFELSTMYLLIVCT